MDKQTAYDRMINHMRKQQAFSLVESEAAGMPDFVCVYRGPNGLMCAVGCLIPDDRYTLDLENQTPANYDVQEALGVDEEMGCFLSYAQQQLHDSLYSQTQSPVFDVEAFEKAAKEFAIEYGLVYRPPAPVQNQEGENT